MEYKTKEGKMNEDAYDELLRRINEDADRNLAIWSAGTGLGSGIILLVNSKKLILEDANQILLIYYTPKDLRQTVEVLEKQFSRNVINRSIFDLETFSFEIQSAKLRYQQENRNRPPDCASLR